MEITRVDSFLEYYERLRQRTERVVDCIPPDRLEWTPHAGAFSFGDVLRHVANIERNMFTEIVLHRPSRYAGHGRNLAAGYDAVRAYFNSAHSESVGLLRELTPEALQSRCNTPEGSEISVWKWLRALAEHEVHHRGQLYLMLRLIDVPTPPLYGLTSEEVRARSVSE